MIKIYCDANIFIDYFYSRKDKFRDLGEFAYQIFKRTLDCEFHIILSDWLLYELKNYIEDEKLKEFLNDFKKKNKIIKVYKNLEDVKNAKLISSHYQDVLHSILAKKAGAKYLITRNIKDYSNTKDLEIKLPENV